MRLHRPKLLAATLAALIGTSLLGGCLHDPVEKREAERRESFDLLTKGQKLKEQGDLVLAKDTFLKALQVSERPVIYYEIADCDYRLGNYEEAVDYLDKAIYLAPDYQLAKSERDLVLQELAKRGIKPPSGDEKATPQQEVSEGVPVEVTPTPEPPPLIQVPPQTRTTLDKETPAPTPVAEAPEPSGQTTDTESEEVAAAKTSEPTPTPAVAPEPTPAPENRDSALAPEQEPVPPVSIMTDSTEEAAPAEESAVGPFGGLRSSLERLGGNKSDDSLEGLDQIDDEQANRAIFPELFQETRLSPADETAAAKAAEKAGRFDEAVRRWTRVLESEPQNVDALLSLGNALYRSGRTHRAEEEYLKAIAVAPDSSEVYFQAGNYYVQTKQWEKAKLEFDRTLEIDPDHLRAENNIAALHLQLGNPQLAIDHLEHVVSIDPNFVSAWLNLALARDDAGDPPAQVLEALENYLRLSQTTDAQSEKWLRTLRQRVNSQATQ